GSGKSRLLWEFFKYIDGIEELRYWHEGRSLSYGEGVAYWALAEMIRARAGIAEDDDPLAARESLTATVERFVSDDRERRLLERAEGVPLYAVETVRMLLDRGVLTQRGSRYVVEGTIADLEVPETLHALVAARLDNLDGTERSLLQDAAVLGTSFSADALSAV